MVRWRASLVGRVAALATLLVPAAGIGAGRDEAVAAAVGLRSTQQRARANGGGSFVRSLVFQHTLRICNAYPLTSGLDIYIGDGEVRLTTEPMPYKHCADYTPSLRAGDRVDFKIEDTSAGTFTIADLPNGDAVLLLVIYRHDTQSTAVSFESHVYSVSAAPQIAVLNTFKGPQQSKVHIQDESSVQGQSAVVRRNELLRFDSVVAIDPGAYELALTGAGPNATRAEAPLVALPREAYVVIRCGVEAQDGESFPEELMVFPRSDKSALGAAGGLRAPGLISLVALLLATLGLGGAGAPFASVV